MLPEYIPVILILLVGLPIVGLWLATAAYVLWLQFTDEDYPLSDYPHEDIWWDDEA